MTKLSCIILLTHTHTGHCCIGRGNHQSNTHTHKQAIVVLGGVITRATHTQAIVVLGGVITRATHTQAIVVLGGVITRATHTHTSEMIAKDKTSVYRHHVECQYHASELLQYTQQTTRNSLVGEHHYLNHAIPALCSISRNVHPSHRQITTFSAHRKFFD